MKIGFTGAGGTGKTTTMELVKELIPLPVLPSGTRDVYRERGVIESDQESMSPQEKLDLQYAIFDRRAEVEQTAGESFIADRTLLCNFAYSQLRCYELMTEDMHRAREEQVKENLKQYDYIFYFPIYFSPKGDDIRQGNYTLTKVIDSLIFTFLEQQNVPYIKIKNQSPIRRAENIHDYVTGLYDSACWGNG
jgi:thymidylate kinase